MIPQKISIEAPFPIPLSVINSAIHIVNAEPAVNMTIEPIANATKFTSGIIALREVFSKYTTNTNACIAAITIVNILVYCDIFLLPASPLSLLFYRKS